MGANLGRITRDWRVLASEDPLWAVYVAPGTRGGRWDVGAFLATGQNEVDRVLGAAHAMGRPAQFATALDFGCGVGRLTGPLARHFNRVIAVDVSPEMLARARELVGADSSIEFVVNDAADLAFVPSASLDLVYSSLVMQHLPRPLAAGYLQEFLRILKPTGLAVIQVAERPRLTIRGLLTRALPPSAVSAVQTTILRYPAPMRMSAMSARWMRQQLSKRNAAIIAETPDDTYGGHWRYRRYFIIVDPAVNTERGCRRVPARRV